MDSRRLCFVVLAVVVLATTSYFDSRVRASSQQLRAGDEAVGKARKAGRARFAGASQIRAGAYFSPGRLHKLVVDASDQRQIDEAREAGAIELADYGSFKLFGLGEQALKVAAESARRGNASDATPASLRDDLNVLLLRSATIDTTAGDAPGSLFMGQAASVTTSRDDSKSTFRIVQFVGPVKSQWLETLRSAGLEPIAYVPNNGYVVRSDADAAGRILRLSRATESSGEPFIQWEGPFEDEYKIHPRLADKIESDPLSEVSIAIQIVRPAQSARHSRVSADSTVRGAIAVANSVIGSPYQVGRFTNIRLRILAGAIPRLTSLPGVINVEPWTPPRLLDERSAEILANNLTDDGKQARSPGYLSWLAAHGFNSRFEFVIDVTDTGVDRGSTDPANLHPDFIDAAGSRLIYAKDYTSDLDPSDTPGHGTLNLSIAAGSNASTDRAVMDADGFAFGIGVAPFALLGSSKIFAASGAFDLADPFTSLLSDGYRDGARVSSNSWGDGSNEYTIDAQEYDTRVRDAAPSQQGNQELVICFAAGNSGPGGFVNSLGAAKNVIAVGASESSRPGGIDGCNVRDSDADNVLDMVFFSSGGPLDDGRMKPDIAAPGSHIQGAASQSPSFNGSGVCGEDFDKPFFPQNQTLYTWSSGTSHSTPQVSGAAALVRQFFLNRSVEPGAALIKALLIDTATYMNGANAGGDLPQARQGWGLLNIDRAFDSVPKIFLNETEVLNDSGDEFVLTGEVKDTGRPFRVALAWTDSPGFSAVAPWVNDLDLEVVINGQIYRGNNFKGDVSQTGRAPDGKNNVEAVWLPAGVSGTFLVRVRASNIGGDGVPGNADSTDQDFALVVYNGERKDVPVAGLVGLTVTGGPDQFADPGESVSLKVTLKDLAPAPLTGGRGTLSSTTSGVSVTTASADFPNMASGQTADSTTAFTFSVDRSVACGSQMQFVLDVASGSSVSRVLFSIPVGRSQSLELFADNIDGSDANWTHASAFKKKKKKKKQPIDTWSLSSRRPHSGAQSWFSSDPGIVADAHLDSVQIELPSDLQNLQLVFFHTFAFESIGSTGFDGGVLELSSGGDFEDLGPKIISGGYNGVIFPISSNPLVGRPAWISGRIGAFQQVVVDLSSFAGKTVTIRFRFGSDQTGSGAGWFIDDVRVQGDRVTCLPASD